LDKDKNSRIAAQRPSEKTAGLRKCMSVCERNKKQELNTLDETDFVRDVAMLVTSVRMGALRSDSSRNERAKKDLRWREMVDHGLREKV
jgi:hypothetical protein